MYISIVLFEKIIHWLENHTFSCFYKKNFGFECPGCGMQRSVLELLKGNFVESFQLYPALATTITLFSMLIIHLIFKLHNGAKYLIWIFALNTVIIIINYILKLINF